MRERGTVKWFSAPKGYGFIKRSSGEEVFVHYSSIEMAGYRKLREGTEVEFELKEGPRGLLAVEVVRVEGGAGEKAADEPSPDKPVEAGAKPAGGSAAGLVAEGSAGQGKESISEKDSSHAGGDVDSSDSAKGQSAGG